MVSQLVISLIILLIPGIIAALIFDTITQHKPWNNFIFSVYVILFGWLSYLPLWLWNKIAKALDSNIQWGSVYAFTKLEKSLLNENIYYDILLAAFFAIFFAYLISYSVNHKWLTRLSNKLGVSDKYGDESLFYYYLNSGNIDWVTVRDFSKKVIYTGKLQSYSENNSFHEITLSDVDVYGADIEPYHVDSVYICGKFGDLTIEPRAALTTNKENSDEVGSVIQAETFAEANCYFSRTDRQCANAFAAKSAASSNSLITEGNMRRNRKPLTQTPKPEGPPPGIPKSRASQPLKR